MGFVKRLNSKELVGDPCNGAEVYPITATNAVYREGGESLEEILTRLGNSIDSKKVLDVTQDFTHNKIHISYTDGTSSDITYDRLGDFTISDSTSNGVKTYTLTFKKPDNTTVSRTLDVPVALAALSDDSSHRLVSDSEKNTWGSKLSSSDVATVALTGNYSDLINPPTIPTEIAIITNMYSSKSINYNSAYCSGNVTYRKYGYMVTVSFHLTIDIPTWNGIKYPSIAGVDANNNPYMPDAAKPVVDMFGMAFKYVGDPDNMSGSWDGNMMPFKVVKSPIAGIYIMNAASNNEIYGTLTYTADNADLLT